MCVHFPDLLAACFCPDCRVCIDRELPLPLPAGTFSTPRAARWHQLLTVQRRIAVALEAPLDHTPILFAGDAP